ncbi:phosphatase PAP2 family protein [Haloplanus rallus]|uniref:Phosphatase PAP2 family protein n=1 Tax=Haloplanus rallus TaxID=1816183 RepID=A0A6B9F6H5_9EURY|nr:MULTISPECIES: phosphatase PAP2 family protein [Haloplanus]QGX96126.1 phosphatase PAP2 family protein [Haloplanus rallus]
MTPGVPTQSAWVGQAVRLSVESAAGTAARTGPGARRLLDWIVGIDAWAVGVILELRHPLLTKLMASVTGLGSASAAVVLLGLCYLAGWRRDVAVATVSLAVAGVVVAALMALVQRPFPPQPVCVTDGSGVPHSFPSGHAAAVTVYALVSRRSEALPFGVVTAVAALVAFSRIYLGTHFLSDTVVGVAIGGAAVVLGRRVIDRRDGRPLGGVLADE